MIALGLPDGATAAELALLTLLHPAAESAVAAHLGYNPAQDETTEFYPRLGITGDIAVGSYWDVDSRHSQARLRMSTATPLTTLQLARLPVRSVSHVYVDYDGRFGDKAGAFAAATEWTSGSDYWVQWDHAKLCRTGLLRSNGWPIEPGTVKVVYRAGYSPTEFSGYATADATESDGTITCKSVNAASIKRAVMCLVGRAFNSAQAYMKKTGVGWSPGLFGSESLGAYSYSNPNVASFLTMAAEITGEVADMLEEFRHYGLLRAH